MDVGMPNPRGGTSDPSYNFSKTGDASKDSVSNRSGGGYSPKDSKAETGASRQQQSRAWHDARTDSGIRNKK
jgi:hypothetical protein